jgi:hypothetical protein
MIDRDAWREGRVLHRQTTFQALVGPEAGDCMRAAIATLLQIDPTELTNWMSLTTDGWPLIMQRELESHGWHFYPLLAEMAAVLDPDTECVLTGPTPEGHSHCVVGSAGGQLLWDPLGGDIGITAIDQAWIFLEEPVPGLKRGFALLLGAGDEWHH